MTTNTWQDGADPWTTAADWSTGATPQPTDAVAIPQGSPQIDGVDVGTVASVSITAPNPQTPGQLAVDGGGALTTTGDLDNAGNLGVDTGQNSGASHLTVGGTLDNSGAFQIGFGPGDIFLGLTASSFVSANALTNEATGKITLVGRTDNGNVHRANLDVTGAAGFGTAGVVSGTVTLYNDALLDFGSGGLTSVAQGASLGLYGPDAFVSVGAATSRNSALDGLASVAGTVALNGGATATTTGGIDVTGTGSLQLDTAQDSGGSSLTIGGAITNEGVVQVGQGPGDNFLGILAPSTLSASAIDDSASATLNIVGHIDGANSYQAEVDVAGAAGFGGAAGVTVGNINLYNDALLLFEGGGKVTTVAQGSELTLDGPQVRIADAGATSSNSALLGLSSVAGALGINYGASVTTTGDLDVTGTIGLDTEQDAGGSTLAIGGTVHNHGAVQIGQGPGDNFLGIEAPATLSAQAFDNDAAASLILVGHIDGNTAFQAKLDLAGAAGFGTAGTVTGTVKLYNDALIDFEGGEQITTIAQGATLLLDGADTFVADGGATTSSSALTGLSSVAGVFSLNYGAALTTSGDVTVTSTGGLYVDTEFDAGGTSLTINGTLRNSGAVQIGFGPGDSFLGITSADHVAVTAFTNSATATLVLVGQSGNVANLAVAGAAGFGTAGVLTGKVDLYYDAHLSFGSGSITSVASGAELTLNGQDALLIDAGTSGSDTALSGLASNAGSISLENGQIVTTTGGLVNSGFLGLDNGGEGSSLTVGGALANSGTINVGNGGIGAQTFLRAASLDNQAGSQFAMSGSGVSTAVLTLQGGLTNAGTFNLYNGVSAQAGGSLDNSGAMFLYGNAGVPTFLEFFGGANNSGTLSVGANASLDVSGAFTDTGAFTVGGTVDAAQGLSLTGQATLVLQGGLIVTPGSAGLSLGAGTTLSGYGGVTLPVANAGAITAQGGDLHISGAVTGSGTLAIANASELELGGATAETVAFGNNVGTLKLDDPSSFTGAITGLAVGDTLDLAGVNATAATVSNGTLTVTAGQQTYTYSVSGAGLAGNDFALQDDGQGGTDVVLGPPGPTVRGPGAETVFTGFPAVLGPFTITDPSAGNGTVTAIVTDTLGSLTADPAGNGAVSGADTNAITLTGTLAEVNAELASLTYAASGAGSDVATLQVTDAGNRTTSRQIAVTTLAVPDTTPVLNAPPQQTILDGTPTAWSGISVVDPYAQTTGQAFTLNIAAGDANDSYTVTGGPGGTVTGQGTSDLTISGTVDQVNSYFADSWFENFALRLANTLEEKGLQALATGNAGPHSLLTGIASIFCAYAIRISNEIGAFLTLAGGAAAGGLGVLQLTKFVIHGLQTGDWSLNFKGLHVLDPDGTLYGFDPKGEFVIARSTEPDNTFQIQARLEADGGSAYASAMTQIAAALGTDSVTFGIGRAQVVWIDGQATSIQQGQTLTLAAGQLSQVSADTYQLAWNTGEVLTVIDHGTWLGMTVGLGSGDAPGSVSGLIGTDRGQGSDFVLPHGTALSLPLTQADLYGTFANAWRVSQAASLLNYAPGQTTATFTDTSFPTQILSLADFPTLAVQQAQAVVQATGVTDPGAVAALEYDYLVNGGDANLVTQEAAYLGNVSTTPVGVTSSGSAVQAVGVLPDQQTVAASAGPTSVTFDVYLTAPATTDTEVDYSVVSSDAGDFSAADFGGTLPTGSITIATGQVEGQITIAVPQGALGTAATKTVDLKINTPAGLPLVAATAKEGVTQPVAGPPAVPELSYLSGFGNFTRNGNAYTLDLGAIQSGEALPDLRFGIDNTATAPAGEVADQLAGTFTVPHLAGYTVSGASLTAPIGAGSSYQGLTVHVDQNKFGDAYQTLTFDPVDTNASGFSNPLSPITLTITDTLEVPGMIYSQAFGDVHIITYNGLKYDFQGIGEFTLAKSNIPGDSFDIQLRLAPWFSGAPVSTIQQVAISLGTDHVTFDWTRPGTVWVDGAAATIDAAHPVLTLAGGTVTEVSSTVYKVAWSTGEIMTVSEIFPIFDANPPYISVVDGFPGVNGPGSVAGLQGEDEGTSNDIQLADGTVLPQPVSQADLYGKYANSWRVSQATSLFDYAPGQTTATFTDRSFPTDYLTLANLPAAMVAQAAALAAAAGITDPGIAQSAELDYLATGDASFIRAAQNVQQVISDTTPATVTPSAPPAASLGVEAAAAKVPDVANGATSVTFTAYLTAAPAADTTVAWTAVSPDANAIDAAAFGGTLPSGTVTIAAGQTSAQFTVAVPQGALGTAPEKNLEVKVGAGATPVFAPTALTELFNSQAEPGSPALPTLAYLGQDGTFSFDAQTDTYTLDLGTMTQGASVLAEQFAVINAATGQADSLDGTFSAPTGTGFLVSGNALPNPLTAGSTYQGLYASVKTSQIGPNGMTLVFTPKDVNDSGYSQTLAPLTLKIVDTIAPPAKARLSTPGTIIFPNVRVGTPESQTISVTNSAAAGAQSLDVAGAASASATTSGSVTRLAPGQTDTTSISVGVDTTKAGANSGAVLLGTASDDGQGHATPLDAADTFVDLFGSAYRPAVATVAVGGVGSIVHVRDAGTATLSVANTDPADGYSESLIASVVGVTGNVVSQGKATTAPILAGATDASSLKVGFSTAQAGTIDGKVIVGLTSDGGTGAGAIDGLGTLALPSQTAAVSVTVDNYAQAALADANAVGTFKATQGGYTLDLGTVAQGSAPVTVALSALNTALGPADLLSGGFSATGSAAFANALVAVAGIGAGGAAAAGTVTLSTAALGAVSETVTFTPVGSNASGYTGALAPQTLAITANIADLTGPSVAVGTSAGSLGASSAPATISFAFSEPVKGFDAADVTVVGGTLGPLVRDASTPSLYTAAFTPAAGFVGQASVSVANLSYTDLAGNVGGGGGATLAVDTVAPAVAITSPGQFTTAARQTITGTSLTPGVGAAYTAGTTVTITDAGAALGTATVGADGTWSTQVSLPSLGLDTLVAADTDTFGNTGTSAPVSYSLQSPPPPPPADTTPPALAFDPIATLLGPTDAVLTGTVADDGTGVASVEVYLRNGAVDLGAATIDGDGTWSIDDDLGRGTQRHIYAIATDGAGNQSVAASNYDLLLGQKGQASGQPYTAVEDRYDAEGGFLGETFFRRNGAVLFSNTEKELPNGDIVYSYSDGTYFNGKDYSGFTNVYDPGQDLSVQLTLANKDGTHTIAGLEGGLGFHSQSNDLMTAVGGDNRFVFSRAFGQDIVSGFTAEGDNHDIVDLPHAHFKTIADVLQHTTMLGPDAIIHLGQGDTIALLGVSKDTLQANPKDFKFHG